MHYVQCRTYLALLKEQRLLHVDTKQVPGEISKIIQAKSGDVA